MTKLDNIAPEVFRQRLLLEGFWTIDVDEDTVKKYLLSLAEYLELRTYGDPIVFAPSDGMGKEENVGYDAFVPLIDSGISGYFWSKQEFYSVVVYTCKGFDEDKAEEFTKSFFQATGETIKFGF